MSEQKRYAYKSKWMLIRNKYGLVRNQIFQKAHWDIKTGLSDHFFYKALRALRDFITLVIPIYIMLYPKIIPF